MTTTPTTRLPGRRRLSVSSLLLVLTGIVCALLARHLILAGDLDPLLMVPAIVATTVGAANLVVRVADRETPGDPR